MNSLTTARLHLRPWRDSDHAPFAALNDDPEVMRYMPRHLSRSESAQLVSDFNAALERRGWGVWALARRDSDELLGYVGLAAPTFTAHFTPCLEVLWRLQRRSWGHGYATEAARACLAFAFAALAATEVVGFTVPANQRSRAVMARLGMRHDPRDDFEHPRLLPGDALRPHVLYRLPRAAFTPARAEAAAR
jgi:RimJ/RimL family protein N-acetyltransferase